MADKRAQAASLQELAWAAGLYDGEGTFGCYGRVDGRKRKASASHLRLSIGQHYDPEVLERFVRAVGTGKIYGPYTHTGNKQRWVIQATGAEAVLIIQTIWPWMSGPKRRQYEAAIKKHDSRPEPSKGGHVCLPDCTCGRQKWKAATDVDPKVARRRQQLREAQRRYRERLKDQ